MRSVRKASLSLLVAGSMVMMAASNPLLASPVKGRSVHVRFDGGAPRQSLLRLMNDTERFVRTFNGADPVLLERLGEARERIELSSDAELAAFAPMAPQLDRMMRVMGQVRELIDNPPAPLPTPTSTGFPAADYPNVSFAFNLDAADGGSDDPDDLPDGTGGASGSGLCTAARQSDGTLFALLNGTLLAEAVQMVASRACDQVVVVIGGGNGSLICIITDLIYLAVRGANDNINYCEDQNDGAELHASYLRLEHLHTDLGDTENSINGAITNAESSINNNIDATETSLTTVVNTSTANIVTQVQNSETHILSVIQAGQDFTLRLEIEKALRADALLASIYLPEAHGGQLALVRQIVVETIAGVLASGEGVLAAHNRLALADAAVAGGHYKDAFHYYAEAYFHAVWRLGDEQ